MPGSRTDNSRPCAGLCPEPGFPGLKDEFDVVRLDRDGFVNVTGVVSPQPETTGEADRIIGEMLEDDPSDRLAVRTRKATPWELIR